MRDIVRGLLACAAMAFLLFTTVLMQEGMMGFRPFLNLEAVLLVVGFSFLMLWVSHPLKDVGKALWAASCGVPLTEGEALRARAILLAASDSAMSAGFLVTVLGVILLLSSVEDVVQVPRRLALALTALFYALLLSKCVLAPLARRLPTPPRA
ncbi:MAG: hypothetical protein HZB91_00220 [Elusimicrobia bacterium]|nr:hypothetical protein [Elusimicrobiota bacterium]